MNLRNAGVNPWTAVVFLLGLVPLIAVPGTAQSPCDGAWEAGRFGVPGVIGEVYATALYDDGSGPALYAGGSLTLAGAIATTGIARWNGADWSAVGGGIAGEIRALAVHDDGAGPRLYAGGTFATAGPLAVANLASWDGTTWRDFGGGVSSTSGTPSVRALASYDSGSGPRLYAGGAFTHAGGVATRAFACWNGSSWIATGFAAPASGGDVMALEVFDDGTGPRLFLGGTFTSAGGLPSDGLAAFDGTVYSAFGSTLLPVQLGAGGVAPAEVHALAVVNLGSGPELAMAGRFSGSPAGQSWNVASWSGSSWRAFGSGLPTQGLIYLPLSSVAAFDDGNGPKLYAGGAISSAYAAPSPGVMRWDGSQWQVFGAIGYSSAFDGPVLSLEVWNLGSGPRLFAGGVFYRAGNTLARSIASWNGSSWGYVGKGVGLPVALFEVEDDGSGPALYASTYAPGPSRPQAVLRWNGTEWTHVGGLFSQGATALAGFTTTAGRLLCAGGNFVRIGDALISHFAVWNGSTWLPEGTPGGPITDMRVFDDGSGPQLYAVGQFPGLIARWNGAAWTSVGGGLSTGGPVFQAWPLSLETYDDGSGEALYVGGGFVSAGGMACYGLARWQNGGTWAPYFASSNVAALERHRDADATALFVGGSGSVNGVPVTGLSRYGPGGVWTAVPIAPTPVYVSRLQSHDDGTGPALYAQVSATIFAQPTLRRYYGSQSQPLASVDGPISAFASFDDGSGSALWIGGAQTRVANVDSLYVARWRRPSPFALALTQPAGAGSIRFGVTCGTPFADLFTTVSFDPRNASDPGNGIWFGLHTELADVLAQYLTGAPPFVASLDAAGNYVFSLGAGALPAALAGTTVWASSHVFVPVPLAVRSETAVAALTLQ